MTLNIKSNKRNEFLLFCANKNFTLSHTNTLLEERMMGSVCEEEWALWTNYYQPLAESCPIYEKEIIYNDRSLAWFAKDLKKRHNKDTIS